MTDLISRQAAIDAIEKAMCEDGFRSSTGLIHKTTAYEVIRHLPSAQQWIPCSKRLPKNIENRYWICTDGGYQCQCRWTNNIFGLGAGDEWDWKLLDIPQYSKVVAWMPLPEPYRGEEQNG